MFYQAQLSSSTMSLSSLESVSDNFVACGPDRILESGKFYTSNPEEPVILRIGQKWPGRRTPVSLLSIVKRACHAASSLPALRIKRKKKWISWTYENYYQDIITGAKAFIALGLEAFHSVCILSFNCPEWFIADIAAIHAGGFACGLYTTNGSHTNKFILNDCRADILIVQDSEMLERILPVKEDLIYVKAIVLIEVEEDETLPDGIISWDDLMALGKQKNSQELTQRIENVAINQCCTLIYTSGTTGRPKGVMLSHDNIAWTVFSILSALKFEANSEIFISYLPLNHIAGQLIELWLPLFSQGQVFFADKNALKGTLVNTLLEVKPTRFFGVPRVWEKFQEGIQIKLNTVGPLKKRAVDMFKRSTLNFHLHGTDSLIYRYGKRGFHEKIKRSLGLERCTTFACGASALSEDVFTFFCSLDMPITDTFGMSESCGIAILGDNGNRRFGSVGRPLLDVKVVVSNAKMDVGDTGNGNGEIAISGRNIMMGYLNDEDKTNEVFNKGGFFMTGDIGHKDLDGFFYITGRSKEIIVTAGGENVAPYPIEQLIKSLLPCVSNVVVIGDRQKYLVAFLALKTLPEEPGSEIPGMKLTRDARNWCLSIGSSAETVEDIIKLGDQNFFFAVQDKIDKANESAVSNVAKVKKWTLLPKDLSIVSGELGPTLKLKRFYFYEKYRKAIQKMYED